MNKKLFVGRLPFGFSNEQLRALFIKSGTVVSAVMVPDAKSGKTRGFGFVDMSTDAEAQTAIQTVNGLPLEDKKIWVTLAREKGDAKQPAPAPARRPFGDRRPSYEERGRRPAGERPAFGDRPARRSLTDRSPSRSANDRPSFGDRSGPPRFGPKPGFSPKKYSPGGPATGRHFTDGPGGASGDRKPPFRSGERRPFRSADARPSGPPRSASGPSSFPKKEFRSRDAFRGPPKRTGGRRPPSRG